MENRRALIRLAYYQEEVLHLLSKLRVQFHNHADCHKFEEFHKLLRETELAASQISVNFCNDDDQRNLESGFRSAFFRASAALPQAPPVQEVPARKVDPAHVQQHFPEGWLENPRPAPAPPGRQRDPIIGSNSPSIVIDPFHWGQPVPTLPDHQRDLIIGTRSTSVVIDPPQLRQAAPHHEMAIEDHELLIDLGQDQPEAAFGISQAEKRLPAALDPFESPLHLAAPSEVSSFGASDSFVTRSGWSFRRRLDIDDDQYWEDIQYVDRDEAESANRAGGAIDTENASEQSTSSEEKDEIDWNTRTRVYAGPCRYF